ncbi:MAG: BMP family ABC transporter substrate-binding protein, partial [Solimonas sp.]
VLPGVPAPTLKAYEDKKKALAEQSFHVFQGPLKDQSGAIKVAAGSALTPEQLMSLSWYVQGVDGALPK